MRRRCARSSRPLPKMLVRSTLLPVSEGVLFHQVTATEYHCWIHIVAIAYVMQKAPYVFPILGGRKVEHLEKNLEALEISLTADHIKRIESVLPFDFGFPYNWFVSDSSANPGFPLQELILTVSRDQQMVNIASSSRLEENSTDGPRSRLFALLLSRPQNLPQSRLLPQLQCRPLLQLQCQPLPQPLFPAPQHTSILWAISRPH